MDNQTDVQSKLDTAETRIRQLVDSLNERNTSLRHVVSECGKMEEQNRVLTKVLEFIVDNVS
jgi:hypothetical protein